MGERGPADLSADQDQHHRIQGEAKPREEPVLLDARAGYGIEWAAEHVVGGGVIALPTDTVYGLGASLAHGDALRRLFAIKDRPLNKPVPVLLASAAALANVALDFDERVERLLARYWPGPLTVILQGRDGMPPEVTGPDGSIGVRVPNHPVALELLERGGGGLAVTSANRSGEPPAR
nr:L-threonylcarbamoyladenylate synthase [Chloroflexota bacterium]